MPPVPEDEGNHRPDPEQAQCYAGRRASSKRGADGQSPEIHGHILDAAVRVPEGRRVLHRQLDCRALPAHVLWRKEEQPFLRQPQDGAGLRGVPHAYLHMQDDEGVGSRIPEGILPPDSSWPPRLREPDATDHRSGPKPILKKH